MKAAIYQGLHWNEPALIIESGELLIKVLPDRGFKLCSLFDKTIQKEFFFQPPEGHYSPIKYGGSFLDYDASGCDEMIPTIDSCQYSSSGFLNRQIPDHGGAWSRPWDVKVVRNRVAGTLRLQELPILFRRTLTMSDDRSFRMEYAAVNEAREPVDFLWALHPLCEYGTDTRLLLPKSVSSMFNVHQFGTLGALSPFPRQAELGKTSWDVRELAGYPQDLCFKFYAAGTLDTGACGLHYRDCDRVFLLEFNPSEIPYLGIWINNGDPGVKGDRNVAVEPANGFFDSLATAQKRGQVVTLEPGATKSWSLTLRLVPGALGGLNRFA